MALRDTLIRLVPAIEPYVDQLIVQMAKYGIKAPIRMAHFLGQCYVESNGFKTVRESLNYSEEALNSLFGSKRISPADAKRLGRNKDHPADQKALANVLYGGEWGQRNLGNILPNDGWDYRGGGIKQLTGRDNYTRFSRQYYGNDRIVESPSLIEQPEAAVASAVWFWNSRGLNSIADRDDVEAVTRIVNGGTNGLTDRMDWTQTFKSALTKGV